MATESMLTHARWEVMWVAVKNGKKKIVCIDHDDDFVSARDLYVKVKQAGKKLPTLRCKNIGFAPPERMRNKMASYNRQGVWWCPYCMELRRFEKRGWIELDEKLYTAEPAYYCPMCDISHQNHHVVAFNPAAQLLVNRKRSRGRRSSGRRKRR